MTRVVFLGPTLEHNTARHLCQADYRPPVAQGDVVRAMRAGATSIGIIDGYFDSMPSIWHKEILHALEEGIPVYGAASMGALRAAELDLFGMTGVGWIYEQFRDGVLIADDEVAIAHGTEETGYRQLSEALVNIRRTVDKAVTDGVVPLQIADLLLERAQRTWFPERSWLMLLQAEATRIPAAHLDALRKWLPDGRVDQKSLDAQAMLLRMDSDSAATDASPGTRGWKLERTIWWDHLLRHAGTNHTDTGDFSTLDTVLDELRLEPQGFRRGYTAALLSVLGTGEAARRAITATPTARAKVLSGRAHLAQVPPDLHALGTAMGVTTSQAQRIVDGQAQLEILKAEVAGDVAAALPDQLRLAGRYDGLAHRAQHKQRLLTEHGLEGIGAVTLELTDEHLVRWFADRVDRPTLTSLADVRDEHGFGNDDETRRALVREHHYVRLTETRQQ